MDDLLIDCGPTYRAMTDAPRTMTMSVTRTSDVKAVKFKRNPAKRQVDQLLLLLLLLESFKK